MIHSEGQVGDGGEDGGGGAEEEVLGAGLCVLVAHGGEPAQVVGPAVPRGTDRTRVEVRIHF